jgi:hypothetical protein
MARATSDGIRVRKGKAGTAQWQFHPTSDAGVYGERRVPVWLACLVLILAVCFVFATTFVFIVAVAMLHDAFHPSILWPTTSVPAKVVMLAAALFGAITPGLLFAHLALWTIPRARHLLSQGVPGAKGQSFREGTLRLARLTAALLPVALLLSLLGAVDPWIG